MITDPALRWVSTAVFVFAGAYSAYRMTRTEPTTAHIDHGIHLIMCVSMAAMAWPGGFGIPLVQAIFFAAALVWFFVSAMRRNSSGKVASGDHEHLGRVLWYHVLMMASMLWMIISMAGWLPGSTSHSHGSGSEVVEGMPGMDMGAGHGGHSLAAESMPAWITAVTGILAAAFAVAMVVWLYRYFTERQRSTSGFWTTPTVASISEVAMAAGMAIMMAAMV
ncbi:MAG: DUF5134 domain-containing protein [Rhodococcus sp. (in: high G+C Gram-positive bacteria)]|uniref:DUF5134 domain-containing protein n=1 Tax=Rhodococcus sp. TaxID=1831 RepID=UPI002ADADAC1|nr:DUF5134 domain-containing protein [Rhodococcus sp. (in: high G+C Gram-positive bacteria)]